MEQLHIYNRSWEATTKLISGRIENNEAGDVIYHAILSDESVSNKVLATTSVDLQFLLDVLR